MSETARGSERTRLAPFGREHLAHGVQIERIGHQHVKRVGGNADDSAAPDFLDRPIDCCQDLDFPGLFRLDLLPL